MPYSYPLYKFDVKKHIIENFHQDTEILDVGAGSGVWSDLLYSTYKNLDALEIHKPYISQFDLEWRYRNVFNNNILNYDISRYQLLILGDIIEHLTFFDASLLLNKIHNQGKKCIVAVPYLYPQGIIDGNVYEVHLQPDLTHELFLERYPIMKKLINDNKYGYYINYDHKSMMSI